MLRVGDTLTRFQFMGNFPAPPDAFGRACLPVGGYGPDVDIALVSDPWLQGEFGRTLSCVVGMGGFCEQDAIDSVTIRTANADECPAPGTVRNGTFDFDSTNAWTLQSSATISSGRLRVSLNNACQSGNGRQRVTFPDASQLANPALRFTSNLTAGRAFQVQIVEGSRALPFGMPLGDGTDQTSTFCIPSWLQGTTAVLQFNMDNANGCSSGVIYPAELSVDDVQFVSDASCDGTDNSVNFDDGNGANRFHVNPPNLNGSALPPVASFETVAARGGRELVIHDGRVTAVTGAILMRVPTATPGVDGPMLRFTHRSTAGSLSPQVRVAPTTDVSGRSTFAATTVDQTQTVCLPAATSGMVLPIEFQFTRGSSLASEDHFLDDVEVVLDATCAN